MIGATYIMTCTCFDEMLNRVEAHAKEQLKETPMVEGSLTVEWQNRVFFLSSAPNAPVALYVNTEYRPIKKDGTPAKNVKKLQNGFKLSHCPFCGTKYESEGTTNA